MRDALTYTMEIAGFALLVWGVFDLLGAGAAAITAGILLAAGAFALDREPAS